MLDWRHITSLTVETEIVSRGRLSYWLLYHFGIW